MLASIKRSAAPALSRGSVRRAGVWAVILLAGLVLLYARYDWTGQPSRYAQRGFWLSAYLLLILLPTAYYGARRLLLSTWAARVVAGAIFVATTLPWTLLGLDRFAYYRDRPLWFVPHEVPDPQFLPDGPLRTFPYYELFMPLLFATGCALIWAAWTVRNRVARIASRRLPVLLTVAFAVICTQAFLHSSLRSPYTYDPHYSNFGQRWYVVYHFRDGSGATNADEFVFISLENYFQGVARNGNNMLIHRPLSFYVASQGSYFVNTFYVWLGLNCLFWLAAVLATGRFATLIAGERAGVIAGALTVFGPGFIGFAATPAMYLQGYAAAAISIWAFEELVVRSPRAGERDWSSIALFTGILSLCSLTYDLLPVLLALIAYGLARRIKPVILAVSIGGAFVATRLFGFLVTTALGIEVDPTNTDQVSTAVSNTIDFIFTPSLAAWYSGLVGVPSNFIKMLLMAFFVIPLVLALIALAKLRDRPLRVLAIALVAGYFVVNAIFYLGHPPYPLGQLPRLVYFVFPVIYLLAAIALVRFGRRATWIVVAVMAVLVNFDVFGHPTPYVDFFSGFPPSERPRVLPPVEK